MFENKVVLITGVSRETGLGYETAKRLKELGLTVIITARELEAVTALGKQLDVDAAQLDVTSQESIEKLLDVITKQYGKLDILINNAGGFFDQNSDLLTVDVNFMKEALDLNLFGALRMIQAFVPLLKLADNGTIVNVTSGIGSFSDPVFGLANYFADVPAFATSKLALNGLTVKLAKRLKKDKIRINAVCPGFVATTPGMEAYGARPVTEGANGIVWAATLPEDGPTGGFFRDGEVIGW
ncbi:SDR family NAD(P)-dependent oxidoreductase [Elizabethkingia bruuniana]|uniref:SDR family NAD(P)-dependent oxidoreductase n=1 Tax=Elizabethkingia bruuniana TaxID=1756149 RepID=UPI00241DED4B|nr:SDR family NAD(P)-dependent oxidoreductase [Elizabethkingia bruuniana]